MKKALLIFLFLLPYLAFAQKKSIDGFLDIPFGSDSATVKATVLAKGGIRNLDTSVKNMGFSKVSLGKRLSQYLYVRLVDNKAFEAIFYFQEGDDLLDTYNSLVTDITAVYGKPIKINNFDELSNTMKLKKAMLGNIKIQTLWQSKNKNTISVEINKIGQILYLVLDYQDDALFDVYDAKRRSDL